tara:strand:+ start:105 stop:401 length:297 start_codon:yes stop_codon:yes gene_type:complete
MSNKDIAGYIGTTLTVVNQIPQIYKAFKSEKTTDISLWFLISLLLAHVSWLAYGIFDNYNTTLILNSSICLLLTKILIYAKYKYSNNLLTDISSNTVI